MNLEFKPVVYNDPNEFLPFREELTSTADAIIIKGLNRRSIQRDYTGADPKLSRMVLTFSLSDIEQLYSEYYPLHRFCIDEAITRCRPIKDGDKVYIGDLKDFPKAHISRLNAKIKVVSDKDKADKIISPNAFDNEAYYYQNRITVIYKGVEYYLSIDHSYYNTKEHFDELIEALKSIPNCEIVSFSFIFSYDKSTYSDSKVTSLTALNRYLDNFKEELDEDTLDSLLSIITSTDIENQKIFYNTYLYYKMTDTQYCKLLYQYTSDIINTDRIRSEATHSTRTINERYFLNYKRGGNSFTYFIRGRLSDTEFMNYILYSLQLRPSVEFLREIALNNYQKQLVNSWECHNYTFPVKIILTPVEDITDYSVPNEDKRITEYKKRVKQYALNFENRKQFLYFLQCKPEILDLI